MNPPRTEDTDTPHPGLLIRQQPIDHRAQRRRVVLERKVPDDALLIDDHLHREGPVGVLGAEGVAPVVLPSRVQQDREIHTSRRSVNI